MERNIWYSRCLTKEWETFNNQKTILLQNHEIRQHYGDRFSDDYVFNYMTYSVKLQSNLTESEKIQYINLIALLRLDHDKKVKHIFFKDKKLRDYLQEMPLADLQGIKQYIKDNGGFNLLPTLNKRNTIPTNTFGLCLHIPYEEAGYAYYFQLSTKLYLLGEYSEKPICFIINEERYDSLLTNKTRTKKDEEDLKAFRLAINTIAYMFCFPNCVIDGVPQNFTEPQYSNFNVTLEKSEQFLEIEKRAKSEKETAITPHFRKGYFKLLRSERFTHKRGQIIFSHPTMVKGNAQTILTDESIDLGRVIHQPDSETILLCKAEDEKILSNLKNTPSELKEKKFTYIPTPILIDESEQLVKSKKLFTRNRQVSINALARAKYKCEYDPRHEIFIRKHSDKGYTEAHHLIPIEYQESFLPYSLDVEANIVSLCSNCHNQIHYGKDANKIIKKLYNQRKNELEAAKLAINIDDLLKMY